MRLGVLLQGEGEALRRGFRFALTLLQVKLVFTDGCPEPEPEPDGGTTVVAMGFTEVAEG